MSPRARSKHILALGRALRWAAQGIGVGLAALLCIGGYFWFSPDLPAPEHLRARAALGSTRILDRRGLALYLNQTYYGGLSCGVEAAAQHFFGKPARDLDLAECALLAGLPQAPSRYDPFADRAAAQARQSDVLDAMARAGYLTLAEAER